MISVAIMGFGTVGAGVYDVISANKEKIQRVIGDTIEVKKILDLREFPGSEVEGLITHDFADIENDDKINVVVETMGGTGAAYEFVKRSLLAGKHVTTSNKALVAAYGSELMEIARNNNINFLYEASVGGGIPIIRTIAESLAGEEIKEITGILNGTTNYILTKMDKEGESFEKALAKAQELGYAEANPEADVEGHDTCRKIAILSSLASGKFVDFNDIYTEGITKIESMDFEYAKLMKTSIKLFGDARLEDGKLYAYVCPVMVSGNHTLYAVEDVFNGIMVEGNMLGKSMYYGSGAGKLPTASAVVGDIIEIAKNLDTNLPISWVSEKMEVEEMSSSSHRYFVRIQGRSSELIERCERIFGSSTSYLLEGYDEFAILTGYMREKDFMKVAEGLDGIIKFIRAKI